MKFDLIFCVVLSLLRFSGAQETGGNIWDMLINGDSINYIKSLQKAPYYVPPRPVASSSSVGFSVGGGGSIAPFAILKPKAEILKLIESFIRLQGEVGSRLYALVVDNWELIRYLSNTVINNIGYLQSFTVNGIITLRKILEFANRLFASWEITVPNVSVDFSTLLRESNFFDEFS
ncbi:uncharacterized protein LOC123308254 [Coccinella septempunctata]|uniref:uncharacterized protein LOC123308254 n=1 Tax=Coccinella septempunctata TaxID=41139 RepID=UPI001D070211|nr:uncharacterized protein LOC123308254 [Coccinella septempunctata]